MFDDMKWCIQQIYWWQNGRAGSFTSTLIEAFRLADWENKRRLEIGFWTMAQALREWENEAVESNLWERYEIEKEQFR